MPEPVDLGRLGGEHREEQLPLVAEVVADRRDVPVSRLLGDGPRRDVVDAALVEQAQRGVEQPPPSLPGDGEGRRVTNALPLVLGVHRARPYPFSRRPAGPSLAGG